MDFGLIDTFPPNQTSTPHPLVTLVIPYIFSDIVLQYYPDLKQV